MAQEERWLHTTDFLSCTPVHFKRIKGWKQGKTFVIRAPIAFFWKVWQVCIVLCKHWWWTADLLVGNHKFTLNCFSKLCVFMIKCSLQLTQRVYLMCHLLFLEVLPFLSLAPLPRRLLQQCKQLSSRTFELPSRSSSPSLRRDPQQDVRDAKKDTQAQRHLPGTRTKYHRVDSKPQVDKSPYKNTTRTKKGRL